MRKIKKQKQKKVWNIPLKWKIVAGVLLVLGIGGYIFSLTPVGKSFLNHVQTTTDYVKNKSGLVVQKVIVNGHAKTPISQINEQIGLTLGMPILDVDLDLVQSQIQLLPWIKSVVVERHLPSTIYIKIEEKKPIALWQNQKEYWPIDEDGQVIEDNQTPVGPVLLVVGVDALEHTPDLIQVLEQYPQIREKVRSAVRIGNRRWNLILNDIEDGLVVKLPETNIEQALKRIAKHDEKDDLLKRDLIEIDVCSPDRIFVQKRN